MMFVCFFCDFKTKGFVLESQRNLFYDARILLVFVLNSFLCVFNIDFVDNLRF